MDKDNVLCPDDFITDPYSCYSCSQCNNAQRVEGVFSCRVYNIACRKVKECDKYRYNRKLDSSKVGMTKEYYD